MCASQGGLGIRDCGPITPLVPTLAPPVSCLLCSRLPHSVLNPEDGVSLCIVVKDPAKGFKEQLAAAPVPGFTKVIGASKLRKNYSQYKDKLALVAQYDAFFADARVVRMMPQLLGKIFDDRRKMPVPVDVAGQRWAENMAEARDSTYLSIGPQTVSVKIGHSGMAAAELSANAMAVLAAAVPRLPKKWANVQRVDVMGTNTVPLPVYKALPQQLVYEDGDSEDEDEEEDGESESEEDASSGEEADDAAVAAAAAKADADAELDDDAEVNALRFLVGKEGAKLSKEPRAGAGAVASSTASAAAAAKPKGKAAAAAAVPTASKATAPASKRARVEAPPSDDDEDDDDLLGDDVDVSEEEEEEADPDVEVEVTRRRKGAIAEKLGATGKAAAAAGGKGAAAGAGKPAAAAKPAGKAAATKPAAAAAKPTAAAAAAPAAAKAAAKKPAAAAPAAARPKAAAKPAAKAGKGK